MDGLAKDGALHLVARAGEGQGGCGGGGGCDRAPSGMPPMSPATVVMGSRSDEWCAVVRSGVLASATRLSMM